MLIVVGPESAQIWNTFVSANRRSPTVTESSLTGVPRTAARRRYCCAPAVVPGWHVGPERTQSIEIPERGDGITLVELELHGVDVRQGEERIERDRPLEVAQRARRQPASETLAPQ